MPGHHGIITNGSSKMTTWPTGLLRSRQVKVPGLPRSFHSMKETSSIYTKKFETWFPNFKVIAFWTHLQEDVLILPVFFPTSLCKYSICVGANVPEKAQQMGTAPWKSLAPWKSSNDGNWKRNFISTVTSSEFFGTSSGCIYVDIPCISTVQTMQQARMACWNRW